MEQSSSSSNNQFIELNNNSSTLSTSTTTNKSTSEEEELNEIVNENPSSSSSTTTTNFITTVKYKDEEFKLDDQFAIGSFPLIMELIYSDNTFLSIGRTIEKCKEFMKPYLAQSTKTRLNQNNEVTETFIPAEIETIDSIRPPSPPLPLSNGIIRNKEKFNNNNKISAAGKTTREITLEEIEYKIANACAVWTEEDLLNKAANYRPRKKKKPVPRIDLL